MSWRARSYAQDTAPWCPLPSGKSQEMQQCNQEPCSGDVDCQFSEWDPWSGCSCSCSGVMRRARRVAVFGRGKGKYCEAATKEIAPCNPADGEHNPYGCEVDVALLPADCQLSTWTEWDACSATCDSGQKQRSRMVEQDASRGGKPCTGMIEDMAPCNIQACYQPMNQSSCEWTAWSEWGGCEQVKDRCGPGVKRRNRDLLYQFHVDAHHCGQPYEEVAFCYRECQHHCVWGDWGAYGECSATCGASAVRKRDREMKLSIVPVDDLFDASHRDLELRAEAAEHDRVQLMAIAFGGGVMGVALAFVALRAMASPRALPGAME